METDQGLPNEVPCDTSATYFDDWPIVWRNFSQAGYATLFAEDWPFFNLFNYLSKGFHLKPVDAYLRPFWVHIWPSFLHRRSTHLCLGSRSKLSLQLDYLGQFLKAQHVAGRPVFALDWQIELGHEWLNQVGAGDEELAAFIEAHKPLLSESFLIVMADHGHRYDSIRESVLGRLEERLPLFSLSLPASLRTPELLQTLRTNAERLSSHFDLYITLLDIISGRGFPPRQEEARWREWSPRGLSLLRPLPKGRTCSEAGIPPDYCVCEHESLLNVSEPVVSEAAAALIAHVNGLLAKTGDKCTQLTRGRIRSAVAVLPNARTVTKIRQRRWFARPNGLFLFYRLMLEAKPSGALLEASVRHEPDGRLTVTGDVNRLNRYGNQSACIQDFVLRKYCLCNAASTSKTSV